MDATPQLAMSAALAMRVRNPLAAVGIGLASHTVLDAIPHYHIGWIMGVSYGALLDVLLGTCLVLVIVAMAPLPWSSALGALAGAFPEIERMATGRRHDFLEAPPFSFPHSDVGSWGALTEVAVTLVAIGLAIQLRRGRKSGRDSLKEV